MAASSALTSDASRHCATDGTATARSRSISPSRCRKRNSDRNPVTTALLDAMLPHCDRPRR
jgi:hypothetical protein